MEDNITKGVVDYLVTLRKEKGMTQQDVANATGMQRANIARIETGNHVTSLDVLMRYANALGYNINFSVEKCDDE